MGAVKRGWATSTAASRRRVSRIDSKIYGVKREKGKFSRVREERRDYIANNRTLVKSNIQTALSAIWARFILYHVRDSRRAALFIRNYESACICRRNDLTISGGAIEILNKKKLKQFA